MRSGRGTKAVWAALTALAITAQAPGQELEIDELIDDLDLGLDDDG